MLVVHNNDIFSEYLCGGVVQPLQCSSPVVISIDPSKSNMAIVIGTLYGEIVDIIEFSGNNRKRGPVENTTDYCMDFKDYIRKYLRDVEMYLVGVEAAITDTKKGGVNHYSDMTLKEIRAGVLDVFLSSFNIRVFEIPQWSWKFAILPDGYRSRSEKGSKRFIREQFPDSSLNAYFEADATDAFCMYMYLITNKCGNTTLICNRLETRNQNTRDYIIFPCEINSFPHSMPATLNEHFTLEENAIFLSNRTNRACLAEIEDVESLTLDDIYGHCRGFSEIPETSKATFLLPPKEGR